MLLAKERERKGGWEKKKQIGKKNGEFQRKKKKLFLDDNFDNKTKIYGKGKRKK